MTVRAARTYDRRLVVSIMLHPEIFETIAEDGQNPNDFVPDVQGEIWLAMWADGEAVGLYHLHRRNAVLIEIHAQVLKAYRKEYSVATGEAALQWILDNLPECQKVIAWVPEIYPNVRSFTESQGFQIEGVNRKSYLKNGKLYDQTLLGITRSEING
jgi:RimJ/RimL family protein N-acetyltransferase